MIDVDRLKASTSIVEVVGRYVELKQDGTEWKGLCPFHSDRNPSFYVVPAKGFCHCFSCGAHHDVIGFVGAIHGVDFKAATTMLSTDLPEPIRREAAPAADVAPQWVPLMPVPADAPPMDPARLWNAKRDKWSILEPVRTWRYLDASGRLLGYVLRCEFEDGGKWTPTVTYASGPDGARWAMVPFSRPRPLYGLELLAGARPVLIVEGEKSADAARELLPSWTCVTWPGGSHGVKHADWTPLAGRDVVIWPDNDAAGRDAANAIAAGLHGHAARVRLLEPAARWPDGYDAADALREGLRTADIVAWAKVSLRDYAPPKPEPAVPRETPKAAAPAPSLAPSVNYDEFLPDANDKGKPLSTIENVAEILRRTGVTARYNVISKREELLIPGHGFSVDNRDNVSLSWVLSECARFRMPIGNVPEYVSYLAERNQWNPVAAWIESREWDGEDRLSDLIATVGAKGEHVNPAVGALKRALITRWMVSAIAGAYRPNGVSAHGVLVFQGEQYVGKTKWFKNLVPAELDVLKDGLILRPDSRDSIMLCVSNWLVELGELDATFRKADIAALKSWLTKDRDELRRAYDRRESHYPRRTVFFASVNPKNYLHDDTGNRRYWTIEVDSLDYDHGLDMQQVWAQVLKLYKDGASWYLTNDEFVALNSHNAEFESGDPVYDLLTGGLDWSSESNFWTWRTATEILMELGLRTPTKSDVTKAAMIMRKINGNKSKRESGDSRTRLLLSPPFNKTRI